MSPQLVGILAAIAAEQARIAAMQIANAEIDLIRDRPKYSADDFFAVAHNLERLSIEARNAQ